MENTYHPRLEEINASLAAGETAPTSQSPAEEQPSVNVAPDAQAAPEQVVATPEQVTAPEQTPQIPTEDQLYYRISRSAAPQDIIRLANEDPQFNRFIREFAGRQAKRDAQARITALEQERDTLLRQKRDIEYGKLTSEEVSARFESDPEFAVDYARWKHETPGDASSVQDDAAEIEYYQDRAEQLLDEEAIAAGVPQHRRQQYRDAFTSCPVHQTNDHGYYDHDQNGVFWTDRFPNPKVAEKAAFDFFQMLVNNEMAQARMRRSVPSAPQQPAAPAPTAPVQTQAVQAPAAPAPQASPQQPASPQQTPIAEVLAAIGRPNTALATSTPDLTVGGAGSVRGRITASELSAMTPPDRIAFMEKMGKTRQQMIEDGTLYVPGLSEKLQVS